MTHSINYNYFTWRAEGLKEYLQSHIILLPTWNFQQGNHKIKMCITLWKQLSIMNFFITTSKKRKFKKRKIDLSYLNDWHSRNGQKNAILVEKHDIVTARFFVTDSKVKELLRMGMGMLGWTAGQKLIKIAWFSYFEFEF